MQTSTIIGIGIGGVALFALWHMWGKKAVATAKGNSATVAKQTKVIRSSYKSFAEARNPNAFTDAVQAAAPEVRGKYTNAEIRAKLAAAGAMS